MPKADYKPLFKNAEVARFAVYAILQFDKVDPKFYPRSQLRDDLVAQIKALRAKTEAKETQILPKPLLDKVMDVLWDRSSSA